MILKILLAIGLMTLLILPAFAQSQSEQLVTLTDKGTLKVGLSTIPSHPKPGESTKLKIDFINKNTNENQQHVDYSIAVSKGDSQVFGVPLTHTAEGSVTIPYEFQESGTYQISVGIESIFFQPIPKETASFSVSVGTESSSKNGCLIATAAYGSELAPQVQYLREFRDKTIMSTSIGSSFINAFNAVYYSFSPTVANEEKNNPILQEFIKISITPLLGILQIAKITTVGTGTASVLTSGTVASLLIGAVYLWPAGLVTKPSRKTSKHVTIVVAISVFIMLALTIISSFMHNEQLMMISSVGLVLSLACVGAILSSNLVWKLVQKIKITFL